LFLQIEEGTGGWSRFTRVACMLARTGEEVRWGRVWMSVGELMPQMWPHGSIAMEVRSS
jgi:hypothetical protein